MSYLRLRTGGRQGRRMWQRRISAESNRNSLMQRTRRRIARIRRQRSRAVWRTAVQRRRCTRGHAERPAQRVRTLDGGHRRAGDPIAHGRSRDRRGTDWTAMLPMWSERPGGFPTGRRRLIPASNRTSRPRGTGRRRRRTRPGPRGAEAEVEPRARAARGRSRRPPAELVQGPRTATSRQLRPRAIWPAK